MQTRFAAATAEHAIGMLQAAGIQTVHIGILDTDSTPRERRLPLAQALAIYLAEFTGPSSARALSRGTVTEM
ncbi:MAG: hypothetical protein ACREEE_12150 [Dongiaceae bacterium]